MCLREGEFEVELPACAAVDEVPIFVRKGETKLDKLQQVDVTPQFLQIPVQKSRDTTPNIAKYVKQSGNQKKRCMRDRVSYIQMYLVLRVRGIVSLWVCHHARELGVLKRK